MFKRKVYDKLLDWKQNDSKDYAVLLEGARRVGKSTIAEEFAKSEFDSYIMIDFSKATKEILAIFDDIADLDLFFLRLQTQTGIRLIKGKSVIVFDEIQLMPKVRQAIKHLVKDGRYSYIETGSLISIKKNVKDIVIPSEEIKIPVYPMDYEEFMWATDNDTYEMLADFAKSGKAIGNETNRKLMRDFRIYMAVGGMPQAVSAYVSGEDFIQIDKIKRRIIDLYKDDFVKLDDRGRISAIFESIPAQLSMKKKFFLSSATGKRTTQKDKDLLQDLLSSKTVLICHNVTEPGSTLAQSVDFDNFKLYMADIGLFTTMLFNDKSRVHADIYAKLLSDKLDANLGYMYENAVAQIINSYGAELYYHTWTPKGSSHSREVDFLLADRTKVVPIEVKSSNVNSHKSIDEFSMKYSKVAGRRILFSQKDVSNVEMLECKPIYMAPMVIGQIVEN